LKKLIINAFKIIFFLGIGVFFIWLFVHKLTVEEKARIYDSFFNANYFWIFLSIIIMFLSHVSRTLRWMILLEPMGYKPRFKNAFLALLIGYFANLALPRLGEITRCGLLNRYEKIPIQKSFGTVVTERALDLILLGLAFLLNFFIHLNKLAVFKETAFYKNVSERYNNIENPSYFFYIAIFTVLVVGFILYKTRHRISHFFIYQKIKKVILGFIEGLKSLIKIRKPVAFIVHSFLIWILYLLMTWVVFFALPETSHLGLDVGLAVLVFGSIGIVLVQGGIGIYPWIVAEILAVFAIPLTAGYAMGWLLWTGQTIMVILAGIVSLVVLPIVNRAKDEKSGNYKIQGTGN